MGLWGGVGRGGAAIPWTCSAVCKAMLLFFDLFRLFGLRACCALLVLFFCSVLFWDYLWAIHSSWKVAYLGNFSFCLFAVSCCFFCRVKWVCLVWSLVLRFDRLSNKMLLCGSWDCVTYVFLVGSCWGRPMCAGPPKVSVSSCSLLVFCEFGVGKALCGLVGIIFNSC